MSVVIDERTLLRDEAAFIRLFDCLRTGGVAIYPTETVYSLGGALSSSKATKKIFALKLRERSRALLSIVYDLRQAEAFGVFRYDLEYKLFEHFGHLGLTVVLEARPFVSTDARGGASTLGVRLATTELCKILTRRLAEPLSSTMANLSNDLMPTPESGNNIPSKVSDVPQQLIDQVDYVIDGGALPGHKPSTLVRVTDDNRIVLYRQGVVTADEIEREFGVDILVKTPVGQ